MKQKTVTTYIVDALFELLKGKPLNEITITELIAKAGISRSSYYRNFYYLEDVLKDYVRRLMAQLPDDSLLCSEDIRHRMLLSNRLFYSERERLTLLENRGLFYLLEGAIYERCRVQVIAQGLTENHYQIAFNSGASVACIREWIRDGFRESPEVMTELFYALLTEKSVPSLWAGQ